MVVSLNLPFQVTQIRYWNIEPSSTFSRSCSCGRDQGRVCCGKLVPRTSTAACCDGEQHACSPNSLPAAHTEETTRCCCQIQNSSTLHQDGFTSHTGRASGGGFSRGSPSTGCWWGTGRALALQQDLGITPSSLWQQFVPALFHFSDRKLPPFDIFQEVDRLYVLWLCATLKGHTCNKTCQVLPVC